MTTAASLAARLRSMPPDDLVDLVVRRRLPQSAFAAGPTSVADLFDLAELLRSEASIDRALEWLPRATIAALHRADLASPDLAPAVALALVGEDGVDDAVLARVRSRPELAVESDLAVENHSQARGDRLRTDIPQDDGERAFAMLTTVAELLRNTEAGRVRELARGGIGLPLARQLGEELGADPDDVSALLDVAAAAELVDAAAVPWSLTDAGRAWLVAPWPERWVELVTRWWRALAEPVQDTLLACGADWRHVATIGAHRYPAGGARLQELVERAATDARHLALLATGLLTEAGRVIVGAAAGRGGSSSTREAALASATAVLPPTVPSVYLQHDLTVIAPGPLNPADDDALRRVATIESAGLANRYRLTDDSVRAALRSGLDHDAIVSTLERLSATDVPQPVRYLVDAVAARDGSIVIDHNPDGRGALLRGAADQLDLVGVDAELRHLGWQRVDLETLATPSPIEAVAARLEAQRYPAVVARTARAHIGGSGTDSRRPARSSTAVRPVDPRAQARALVDRLEAAAQHADRPPEQEWLGRQIDLAVRDRSTITLTVAMPDGTERPFTIVPTAVAGGRVRGRDIRADVERTLPLSLVLRVETPEPTVGGPS
ncbi:helicase-associated domain-containing protein [Curtobacterium ammoniigenes]|uniref:helicase-associated domain-containing protein n=1 Tax=Curtobacterium ammoniigenes TaxID=395387 RepID=UPI0008302ABF|nr:helicase-associated domain-containing protein [Curtobacterium ammoniigenes]